MGVLPDKMAGHPVAGRRLGEVRLDLAADRHGSGTARVETAAARRVGRVGHVSGQDDALPRAFDPRIGNWDR
jgi:hypothetical protein